MALKNFIAETVWLRLSDLVSNNHVRSHLSFLMTSSNWTRSQIEAYQIEKLRVLISHASEHVPFYRDYFKKNNLSLDDFTALSDINKLPIVSKSVIRELGADQFIADNVSSIDSFVARSSGSTGEPFSFYISKDAYSFNMATKLRTWYHAGYRLGDSYMKIGVGKGRTSLIKKIQDKVNNCDLVPYFALNEQNINRILDRIESEKPLFIRSYPSPLYALAKQRIHNSNKYHHNPRVIFTTGSTLPDDYRSTIEKSFGCSVVDSYSCEGCPNVAQEYGNTNYLVSDEYGLVEVLDNNGKRVENGIGRSVVTDFWNFAQPFIRYDTQDLVEISSLEKDRSGHSQIVRIMGRECQSITTPSGRLLTEHEFTTIKYSGVVDSYQIVVKDNDDIVMRIVPNENFDESASKEFQSYWADQFEMPISVEIVSDIPIMENNKRLSIVRE